MKEKKTIKANKWLEDMDLQTFKEVWIEWYLPALRNIAHRVSDVNKKLDTIIEEFSKVVKK